MAVKNIQTKRPKIWIPPLYSANYKITVERNDGTLDDITDIILNMTIEDGVTEGIGNFKFEVPNGNETYTTTWTGMEIFRYYSDYATDATTLRFRGRIEKPSKIDNNIVCTGRGEALFVHGQNVFKSYIAQDSGVAIKDLFDTYGESRYDTSEIPLSTGELITLTFTDLPFWDAIEAICTSSGYDCYVNASLVVKFFAQGSIINSIEGIIHDNNLISTGDFASDNTYIRNQIRVTGGTINGVKVRYTANDLVSQASKGIRSKNIINDGIITFDAAKELANFELTNNTAEPNVGKIKCTLLSTIQPGEKLRISDPLNNIQPGTYRIIQYEHNIDMSGDLTTTVIMNKKPRTLSLILKDRIKRENETPDSTDNQYNLDFATIELFNESTGSFINTQASDGILQLTPGKTTGKWISPTYSSATGTDITKILIALVGDNLPGVTIEVSTNNGISYTTVTRDELINFSVTGKSIKVRLSLLGSTTQIDSMQLQYSTTA